MVLALVTALFVGLLPAIRASATDSHARLRSHGKGERRSPSDLLIVGQVTLTLILLVGAMLFVRSLRAGFTTDLGFNPEPVAAVSVDLFRYGYDGSRAMTYYDEALRRARAIPAVSGAALATHVPLKSTGTLPFDAPAGRRTEADPFNSRLLPGNSSAMCHRSARRSVCSAGSRSRWSALLATPSMKALATSAGA